MVIQPSDRSRLEGTIARSLETQNFTFLVYGCFYRLLYSLHPGSVQKLMADQWFKSRHVTGLCLRLSQCEGYEARGYSVTSPFNFQERL